LSNNKGYLKLISPIFHFQKSYQDFQYLQAVLNIPSGMQIDFYDKINHITHGAVHSEELKKE
jgi:ribosome maturation protein Sdo1